MISYNIILFIIIIGNSIYLLNYYNSKFIHQLNYNYKFIHKLFNYKISYFNLYNTKCKYINYSEFNNECLYHNQRNSNYNNYRYYILVDRF